MRTRQARIVPTGASLHHLWWLAQLGLDGTARFAPPAPATAGILLLTVAGIGMTAVATDLLAVRLHRPAVAGLPLLVLFCVPLTVSSHRSVFGAMTVFVLGMIGYLAMLAADGRERLRVWGRLVTLWQPGQDPAVAQRVPEHQGTGRIRPPDRAGGRGDGPLRPAAGAGAARSQALLGRGRWPANWSRCPIPWRR